MRAQVTHWRRSCVVDKMVVSRKGENKDKYCLVQVIPLMFSITGKAIKEATLKENLEFRASNMSASGKIHGHFLF